MHALHMDKWIWLVGRLFEWMDGWMDVVCVALYCIAMHICIERINILNTHILRVICEYRPFGFDQNQLILSK